MVMEGWEEGDGGGGCMGGWGRATTHMAVMTIHPEEEAKLIFYW